MNTKQDNIIRTDYAEIMQKSYIDYAMADQNTLKEAYRYFKFTYSCRGKRSM